MRSADAVVAGARGRRVLSLFLRSHLVLEVGIDAKFLTEIVTFAGCSEIRLKSDTLWINNNQFSLTPIHLFYSMEISVS